MYLKIYLKIILNTLIEAGYLRFSFLISFISKSYNPKKIIIAPTGIDAFKSLSLKRNL